MNPNFLYSLLGLILGLTCSGVAVILAIYRKRKIHIVWLFFNVAVAIWGFGAFLIGRATTPLEGIIAWRLSHIGVIFIAVLFFHTAVVFCDREKELKKMLLFAYLQGIFFLFLNATSLFISKTRVIFNFLYYNHATGLFYPIFFFIWISLVVWGHVELVVHYRKTSGIKRNQILYFFVGTFSGFLGGTTNFFPMFKIDIYPFGNLTIPIYCIIVTYAILRYRLMDINIIVKKTAVYSLSAGILTSFFIILILAMTKYLSNLAGITSFTVIAIAALIIAFLFNPIRNRVQTIIDKIFYKRTYDYYATIQKVSHELASTFNLRKIYSSVGDTIFSTLGLKNIYLLSIVSGESYRIVYFTAYGKDNVMKDEKAMNIDRDSAFRAHNTEYRIQASDGTINGTSEIVKLLRTFNNVVIREELPQIHKISQEVVDKVNTDLKPFNGEVVVPVFIDGKLELLMVLGEKQSADIFSDEDIRLLNTISNQAAIAIKNARLYEEKVYSERLASIGMISATFAHEIKNPLTSIKTFAQLLPERFSDRDFRENFSKIVIDSVNRIDGLISEFLNLSSGRTSGRMSTVNITGLIDQIIDEVKANLELRRKKINIEKDYKNIKVDVLGDEKRLRQAFINIIMNGCQAIPDNRDDGVIKVSINPNGENVDMSISDNGDGISTEDVHRIFEPFFSTKTIGAGLGLAITKKIVEDHCGKIVVDSEFKKGTTFKITLPIKKMEARDGNLSIT